MQHLLAERMHLHVSQQYILRLGAEFHRQDRRMERLVLESVHERIVVKLDRLRLRGAAVDDARRAARAAQPAARAATLDASRKGGEFVMHRATPLSAAFRSFGPQAPRSSAVATHPGTRRVRGKALNYM